jgi:hypothetical protein
MATALGFDENGAGIGEMQAEAAALRERCEKLKEEVKFYEGVDDDNTFLGKRVEKLEAANDNARIMLVKLAKNPQRFTGDEIRDALQRWGMTGNPLRDAALNDKETDQ